MTLPDKSIQVIEVDEKNLPLDSDDVYEPENRSLHEMPGNILPSMLARKETENQIGRAHV